MKLMNFYRVMIKFQTKYVTSTATSLWQPYPPPHFFLQILTGRLQLLWARFFLQFKICVVDTGENYLQSVLRIPQGEIYRLYWFCLLLGALFVFMALAAIALRLSKEKGFSFLAKPDTAAAFRNHVESIALTVDEAEDLPQPTVMSFKNMNYSVGNGEKQLLSSVSGVVPPKQMVALMVRQIHAFLRYCVAPYVSCPSDKTTHSRIFPFFLSVMLGYFGSWKDNSFGLRGLPQVLGKRNISGR